jgi:hypothetical protein
MRSIAVAALLLLTAGCASLPMMPWDEAELRRQLRGEGFTRDIRISSQGQQVNVYATGLQEQVTERMYMLPGMQLRRELTDRGDNSFMRQEINAQGEVTMIEFWVGDE